MQQNTTQNTMDKIHIKKEMDKIVLAHLRPVTLGIVLVFSIFAVYKFFVLPKEIRFQLIIHDLIIISCAIITNLLVNKGKLSIFTASDAIYHPLEKHANFITALLSFAVLSNIIHSFAYIPRSISGIHLIMFFFGASTVFLSRIWFSTILIVGLTFWSAFAWMNLNPIDLLNIAVALLTTMILAYIILEGRIMIQHRLITLRLEDEKTKQALYNSLAQKNIEIQQKEKIQKEKYNLESQLIQAQKLEAVGRLAGGIAHDINNMLAAITGTTQALLNEVDEKHHHREDIDTIMSACERGKELTLNLLGFARKGKYKKEKVDMNLLLKEVHTFMSRSISKNILFDLRLSPNLNYLEGDFGQLKQVMVNLVNNAIDAMGKSGDLIIMTQNVSQIEVCGITELEDATGNYVKIVVSDTGIGMNEATLQKVFDPFFSTKKTGEGSGLGLSMVYGTISNHGGKVLIRSAYGQGTAVTIYLPEYDRESLQLSTVPANEKYEQPKGTVTVLLVDDEPLVLRSASRILTQLGYRVINASSGKEAIEKYNDNKNISIVLLDLIMPGLDGEQTFELLTSLNKDVKIIFVSAYSKETTRVDNLIKRGAVDFIQKPFSSCEINNAICRAFKE